MVLIFLLRSNQRQASTEWLDPIGAKRRNRANVVPSCQNRTDCCISGFFSVKRPSTPLAIGQCHRFVPPTLCACEIEQPWETYEISEFSHYELFECLEASSLAQPISRSYNQIASQIASNCRTRRIRVGIKQHLRRRPTNGHVMKSDMVALSMTMSLSVYMCAAIL